MKKLGSILICVLLAAGSAPAVIIAGGDGSGNTTGTGVAGWDYVGKISSANGAPSSVTYLGNSWFITAYHVRQLDNPTGVVLNASSYVIDSSSWTRVTNSTGTGADLVLFKVTGSVDGLSALAIADSTPTNGTALTMIGDGRNRDTSLISWYVDTTPATWVWNTNFFFGADALLDGYKYASGAAKRWGSNTVDGSVDGVNDGYGITDMFYTDFDAVSGEAQGATYDSGGGVFTGTASDVELAGIMITVANYNNQPAGTAVFGDATYIADLSAYRDQINQVIPEPAVIAMLLIVPVAFFIRRRLYM